MASRKIFNGSGTPSPAGGGIAAANSVAPVGATPEEKAKFFSEWEDLQQNDMSSADYYFNSYAHFSIHEEMIKDSVRTGTYQRAITKNAHLFRDKIVLDIGSGTGILSLFAARAGAKHVYGIECSEIVHLARVIVEQNRFSDKVTFIQGKAEEVTLPVEKVDIIISEWMGYFLLYESMLDTVIFCRDKWLVEGGLMFPDKARLFIAAIEDEDYKEEKFGFWDNVYGFDYTNVKKTILEEPVVDVVDDRNVVTDACCVLVTWFDVIFSACHKPVTLSTSPDCRYTHWKQTVFYMEHVLVGESGDKITGMIAVKKSEKNPRDLVIKLSYNFKNKNSPSPISNTQFYGLR